MIKLGNDVKDVLILSGAVGKGHDAMAAGIAAELRATHPGVNVTVRDGLDIIKPGMATEWREGYEQRVNIAGGALYSALYRAQSLPGVPPVSKAIFNHGAVQPLADAINAADPDVVVSTFPYVASAVAKAKERGLVPSDLRTVTTLIDPDPHAYWFGRGNEAHAVMFPGDVPRIEHLDPLNGTSYLHLEQARPPLDVAQFTGHDRAAVRAEFGLPVDRPVVLVSGGSLGLGMDRAFVQKLVRANPDVTYAIAAGRNDALAAEVAANFTADQAVAIPYTNRMAALLATSDAAITNSGGMTTIEAFASGTPVILHNVVPGHGVDAARALDDDGIAVYAKTARQLRSALSSVGDPAGDLATTAKRATRQLFAPTVPSMSDVVLGTRPVAPLVSTTDARTARELIADARDGKLQLQPDVRAALDATTRRAATLRRATPS